ncbi:hypothetical protein AB4851_13810 [Burkholderia sp. 22PA0099]
MKPEDGRRTSAPGQRRLAFVDIAAPGFDPTPLGVDQLGVVK